MVGAQYAGQVADVPEETEFIGIANLLRAVSRYSDVGGKVLYACLPSYQERWRQWGVLDDVVSSFFYFYSLTQWERGAAGGVGWFCQECEVVENRLVAR